MNDSLDYSHYESVKQLQQQQTNDCVFQHFLDLQLVGEHQYSASLLHSHDTDTRATMNLAVGNGVIAAGQDGTCCLMKFKHCTQKGGKAAAKDGKAYCYNIKYTCCLRKDSNHQYATYVVCI